MFTHYELFAVYTVAEAPSPQGSNHSTGSLKSDFQDHKAGTDSKFLVVSYPTIWVCFSLLMNLMIS